MSCVPADKKRVMATFILGNKQNYKLGFQKILFAGLVEIIWKKFGDKMSHCLAARRVIAMRKGLKQKASHLVQNKTKGNLMTNK